MHRNRQSQRRQTHEQPENTDTIMELELEALTLSIDRNQLSEQALKIKTEALMEVEAEWTSFQAKALSTQAKRNAAADDRMALNEEYPTLVNDIREIDTILKELAINISFEKRQFTRATDHIEDLHAINTSLSSIATDVHAVALKTVNGY